MKSSFCKWFTHTPILRLFLLLPLHSTAQHSDSTQIPVLCYHNIKPALPSQLPAYTISAAMFRTHIKMLQDSGYTSILPQQLIDHFTTGAPLPPKPVLISFDDSHEEHYTIAMPVLNSCHFKGVFFVMTVTINKPRYMSTGSIKALADSGHCIALHTWDHQDVRKLKGNDWDLQIGTPKRMLEKITGRPVQFFAYPFGTWDNEAIQHLINFGIKAAFQLSGKQSFTHPLYTIRRLLVAGDWNAAKLHARMEAMFHPKH